MSQLTKYGAWIDNEAFAVAVLEGNHPSVSGEGDGQFERWEIAVEAATPDDAEMLALQQVNPLTCYDCGNPIFSPSIGEDLHHMTKTLGEIDKEADRDHAPIF